MTKKVSVAVVSVIFLDGEGTTREDVQLSGTAVTWFTEDMTIARNLRGQLTGLLGDQISESLLPMAAADAIENLTWPGSVRLDVSDP